jgi:hypothetical protein
MKAKELVSIFDTACRRLKNHFGLEADSVKIVKLSKYPEFADKPWVAVCQSQITLDCKLSSELLINPDKYLKHVANLNEQTLRNTVVHTACHEMAHHLARFRINKRWLSDDLAASSPADRWQELRRLHSTLDPHGLEWSKIMENEMLVDAHIALTPYPELSPIVRI